MTRVQHTAPDGSIHYWNAEKKKYFKHPASRTRGPAFEKILGGKCTADGTKIWKAGKKDPSKLTCQLKDGAKARTSTVKFPKALGQKCNAEGTKIWKAGKKDASKLTCQLAQAHVRIEGQKCSAKDSRKIWTTSNKTGQLTCQVPGHLREEFNPAKLHAAKKEHAKKRGPDYLRDKTCTATATGRLRHRVLKDGKWVCRVVEGAKPSPNYAAPKRTKSHTTSRSHSGRTSRASSGSLNTGFRGAPNTAGCPAGQAKYIKKDGTRSKCFTEARARHFGWI